MLRKIEAILSDLKLPRPYADKIAKQQTKGQIEHLRFCDAEQTYRTLQSLCIHQSSQAKRTRPPPLITPPIS